MVLSAIEQDIPVHELLDIAQLKGGELDLVEAQIGDDSPAVGRKPSDITLPEGCSLFLLLRGKSVQQIRPDTVFQSGDKVLAVSRADAEQALRRELIGDRRWGRRTVPDALTGAGVNEHCLVR